MRTQNVARFADHARQASDEAVLRFIELAAVFSNAVHSTNRLDAKPAREHFGTLPHRQHDHIPGLVAIAISFRR